MVWSSWRSGRGHLVSIVEESVRCLVDFSFFLINHVIAIALTNASILSVMWPFDEALDRILIIYEDLLAILLILNWSGLWWLGIMLLILKLGVLSWGKIFPSQIVVFFFIWGFSRRVAVATKTSLRLIRRMRSLLVALIRLSLVCILVWCLLLLFLSLRRWIHVVVMGCGSSWMRSVAVVLPLLIRSGISSLINVCNRS